MTQKKTAKTKRAKSAEQASAQPNPLREGLEGMLISCMPNAIIVVGEDSKIAYANPAAELFFSSSSAVMKRKTLADILGFDSPVVALAHQVRARSMSVNEYNVEIALPKTAKTKLIDAHVCRLADCDGLVMIILQERNMAMMIERQLVHKSAVKSVTALGAMLAHEIKNPLSGIKGAAQLLEPDLSDADRELSQLICTETDRIVKIVDRMDMFNENPRLEYQPQNIHEILNHVISLAQSGFGQDIVFKTLYDPSLPPVSGHRDNLIQIYLNLVKNAAEALTPNQGEGQITIHTAYRPGMRMSLSGTVPNVSLPIGITIEDNGPGISKELRPHIFDPFVTTKFSGSGLGLALTAKLINDHGGILDCDSYPGRTKFTTLLPKSDVDFTETALPNPDTDFMN